MRYFVIGSDGQKYGPADIGTLNEWIGQGRLLPNTLLEEEASGQRVAASAVPGLSFPAPAAPGAAAPGAGAYSAGQPYQGAYARPMAYGDGGEKDLKQAWMWAVISFFCCAPLTAWLAFNAAKRAEQAGNPNAKGPRIVATIAIVVWILSIVVRAATFSQR